jgi:hypothetical protein
LDRVQTVKIQTIVEINCVVGQYRTVSLLLPLKYGGVAVVVAECAVADSVFRVDRVHMQRKQLLEISADVIITCL